MTHTQKSAQQPGAVDQLRQQLTDADNRLRQLLVELYVNHDANMRPFIELLIGEAKPETLAKLQVMLLTESAS